MNKHRSGTLLLRVAPSHRRPVSRGYTFLELIVGMIATGALVAGTTAAIAVAMQTVRIAQAPNSLVKCSEVLEELAGRLTLADVVWNAGSMELVCNLVDIDGDGRRDHVRYWWSGIAGSPLWRSLNGGPRESVTPSVASFRVDYQT